MANGSNVGEIVGTKTLFRYPGGKYYALKYLRKFVSTHHTEYRDPFVGGGSVFFDKAKVRHNWINDFDDELIKCYQTIQNPVTREILTERFSDEIANKTRYSEVKLFTPTNDFEIAWKYYYMNRTSFSGKMISPSWGYREKRSLPPSRWHERINPCGEKLENVKITCLDFEDVIAAPSDDEVLMFVDPPYFNPTKKKHYRHGFTHSDHVRLCESLKSTKHKFVLTYDDCEEIRELYSWANIHELEFFYRVGDSQTSNAQRKLGFELIITNFIVHQED